MRVTQAGAKGKTALVLAGGGLTGAVYEIGALRAIDDLLVGRTVNDFDIYVGTSAGALVAACLANNLSPHELMQVFDASHPEIEPVARRHIFSINRGELARRAVGLPQVLLAAWSHYLRHLNDMTLFDLLWSLFEAFPSAMYDGQALERYIRHTLAGSPRSNTFNRLERELHIIATDLDSGERVVFGPGSNDKVPISLAIAASSALPLVYKPVRIGHKECVDGGLRGTASLDLAIEQGA
ncbi:MAG: patatin-like phospholipase family protein, partial [Anaerolineae bacterium]